VDPAIGIIFWVKQAMRFAQITFESSLQTISFLLFLFRRK